MSTGHANEAGEATGSEGDAGAAGDDGSPTREQLTALHRGLLPREQARSLRARIDRDPAAMRMLGEIAGAELATRASPAQRTTLDPPDAARAALGLARSDPRAWVALATAAVVALGAVMLAAALSAPAPDPDRGSDLTPAPRISAGELVSLWPSIRTHQDRGVLTDEQVRDVCLPESVDRILGSQPVIVDGSAGLAVAYVATSSPLDPPGPPTAKLIALSTDCASTDAAPLAEASVPL